MSEQATIDFAHPTEYPPGFWLWFNTRAGQQIWTAFEVRALQMAAIRKHYSAQSIVEVIRWHTSLHGGDEFKINNNWVAGLARFWLVRHGKAHPKFFLIRDSQGLDK